MDVANSADVEVATWRGRRARVEGRFVTGDVWYVKKPSLEAEAFSAAKLKKCRRGET